MKIFKLVLLIVILLTLLWFAYTKLIKKDAINTPSVVPETKPVVGKRLTATEIKSVQLSKSTTESLNNLIKSTS